MTIHAQVLADLKAAISKQEAELEALAKDDLIQFVIIWHDAPLKLEGQKVGLLGSKIYTSTDRSFMAREAARFAAQAGSKPWPFPGAPRSMEAADALAEMRAKNAILLASIPKA